MSQTLAKNKKETKPVLFNLTANHSTNNSAASTVRNTVNAASARPVPTQVESKAARKQHAPATSETFPHSSNSKTVPSSSTEMGDTVDDFQKDANAWNELMAGENDAEDHVSETPSHIVH